jgi:hypothetical protein
MEQRSLRLGDLVDDYCPRERRVTNHVIVVLAGDAIRQTRCNTCDAEHDYKEAKVPRKKLKGDASGLTGGVLVPKGGPTNGMATDEPPVPAEAAAPAVSESPSSDPPQEPESSESNDGDSTMPDGWLAHRPLIRATLPRSEGDAPPPPRAIPEFTMHQRQGRGFGGRGGHGGFRHGFAGHNGGRMPPNRDGNGQEPDGNRAPSPGGGKSRHRRRRRR